MNCSWLLLLNCVDKKYKAPIKGHYNYSAADADAVSATTSELE